MRVIVTIVSETVPIGSIAELRRKRSTDENGRFKAQYRKEMAWDLWRLWSAGIPQDSCGRNAGQEWQATCQLSPRDADGDVAIILSGDLVKGCTGKVDLRFWHKLTYKVGV
jgi:hypothetical protein